MENKEEKNRRMREWRKKNPNSSRDFCREHREEYRDWLKVWRLRNPEKVKESARKDREKHKEKVKSRIRANNRHLRENKCVECGEIENLEFHHTNYELDEGFTVCTKCHGELHRGN